tara:strand:- start:1 stop:384 length:384 start_codon:yes stop_codon:yes gene_type:complete
VNDNLSIEGLKVDTIIGVYQWEREVKQSVIIDLVLEIKSTSSGFEDSIEFAVDYVAVSDMVSNLVQSSSFLLIESLAEAIAGKLLKEFAIRSIRLKLSKPSAIQNAANVGITIERSRDNLVHTETKT